MPNLVLLMLCYYSCRALQP